MGGGGGGGGGAMVFLSLQTDYFFHIQNQTRICFPCEHIFNMCGENKPFSASAAEPKKIKPQKS